MKRTLAVLAIILTMSGCSTSKDFRHQDGHCIVQYTHQVFGMTYDKSDWNCR